MSTLPAKQPAGYSSSTRALTAAPLFPNYIVEHRSLYIPLLRVMWRSFSPHHSLHNHRSNNLLTADLLTHTNTDLNRLSPAAPPLATIPRPEDIRPTINVPMPKGIDRCGRPIFTRATGWWAIASITWAAHFPTAASYMSAPYAAALTPGPPAPTTQPHWQIDVLAISEHPLR